MKFNYIYNPKHLHFFLLFIIIVFSFIFRLNALTTNPAGFFCDEASVGYDAYHILQTGKDRHNEFLPLFFKGFNYDNVSPYHVYLTVPFIALFGLNETAVRLTPVFWSIVELIVFYLLLRNLIPNWFALIGTTLLSLSPWHFHISRINMGDFYSWTLLTLIGYYFLIRAFHNNQTKFFIFSSILFGFATYSYTPARLITPVLFFCILLILFFKKNLKFVIILGIIYTTVLIPFVYFHVTDPHSFQRIKDTMGIDIKKQSQLNNNTISLSDITNKYISHYSATFLFEKGDADFPGQFIFRHSIPRLGLLYPYQAFFITVGLLFVTISIVKKRKIELLPIIILFLIFPLGDSLTKDKTPFATRSYLGVLPFHILIAFGVFGCYLYLLESFTYVKKIYIKKIYIGIIIILLINSFFQLITHFKAAPQYNSDFWGWQYGPKYIISYFVENESKYDKLYMIPEFNAPDIFFKFYAPNGCRKCGLGTPDTVYDPNSKQLFALTPKYLLEHPSYQFKTLKTIYYPNKNIAFQIGEVVQ